MEQPVKPEISYNSIFKNERCVKSSFVLFFLLLGIFLDQFLKQFIFSLKKLPIRLTQFKNFNFAFSIPLPVWSMFVIYGIVILIAVIIFFKNFNKLSKIKLLAWALLFAGAFSNIGERILLGYVRDYLVFLNGIFNLADIFIIIGILLLL